MLRFHAISGCNHLPVQLNGANVCGACSQGRERGSSLLHRQQTAAKDTEPLVQNSQQKQELRSLPAFKQNWFSIRNWRFTWEPTKTQNSLTKPKDFTKKLLRIPAIKTRSCSSVSIQPSVLGAILTWFSDAFPSEILGPLQETPLTHVAVGSAASPDLLCYSC